MSRFRFGLTTLLVGFILTIVFWLPLYRGGGFVGGDVYSYYFPQKSYYAEQLRTGEIPLWNNRTGFGYPVLGESQTGVFYPFHLLLYSTLDVNTAYNYQHLLHYVLSFAFSAFYARRLGLNSGSALFCALIYTYGWFPSRCCVEWAIIGGAWLPAALWCLESFLQSRLWRYAIGMSLVLALQMLAGHFQLAFITQLVLVGYVLLRIVFKDRESAADRSLVRFPALLILGSAVALSYAVAAVQLLPTWELKHRSQRATVGENHDLAFGFIPVWYWSQTIRPWHWYAPEPISNRNAELQQAAARAGSRTNEIEAHLYFGLTPLALGLWGIISGWKNRQSEQRVWSVLGFSALVYATGWPLPFMQFLPGFSFFQGPGRFGIVTTLAVAVLAGITLDRLLSQNPVAPKSGLVLLVAMTAAGLSTWILLADTAFVAESFNISVELTTGLGDLNRSALYMWLFIAIAVATVSVWALLRDSRKVQRAGRVLIVCALFAITIADLWLVSRLVTTCWMVDDPPIAHLNESPIKQHLAEFPTPARIFAPAANLPNMLDVSSTPVYLTFGPAEYDDPRFEMPDASQPESEAVPLPASAAQIAWLQRASVTHVLSLQPLDRESWPASPIWQGFDPFLNRALARPRQKNIFLYELHGSRGRAAWEQSTSAMTAKVLEYTPNKVAVRTESNTQGRLVLTDLHYPGWQVSIDGRVADPVRLESSYRAVDVPAGTHVVVWKYSPTNLSLAITISAIAILLLAAVAHVRFWYPSRLSFLELDHESSS